MLDLLNPTPTQRLIERELLEGRRDICWHRHGQGSGKGVAAYQGDGLMRKQYHKEMGIGSGDYPADSRASARSTEPKAYFQDVCRQLDISFRPRGNPDPHFEVRGPEVLHLRWGQRRRRTGRCRALRDGRLDRRGNLVREDVYEAATLSSIFRDSRVIAY